MGKWIEILRPGAFTDMSGKVVTFSAADLADIAAKFVQTAPPSKAPLVLGHPDVASPAYGWTRALKVQADTLLAEVEPIPEAVELVRTGAYRNVSASLNLGTKELRHIGLLGAVAPAVDGLKPLSFAEAGDNIVTIELATPDNPKENDMELKEALAKIDQLEKRLAEQEKALREAKAAKDKAEAAAKDQEAKFAAAEATRVQQAREARVEALLKADKITPGQKESILQFAAAMSADATLVAFASADGKAENISLEEKYLREWEAREPLGLQTSLASAQGAPANNAPATTTNLAAKV